MTVQAAELAELKKRLGWLEEERSKANQRLSEMEQKVFLQSEELTRKDKRIRELETGLSSADDVISSARTIDQRFEDMRQEMRGFFTKVDDKQADNQRDIERLRKLETTASNRELLELRQEIPTMNRLQAELENRSVHDGIFQTQITSLEERFPLLERRLDEIGTKLAFLEETVRTHARNQTDTEARLIDLDKRSSGTDSRIDSNGVALTRVESKLNAIETSRMDVEGLLKKKSEQIQLDEFERNKQAQVHAKQFEDFHVEMRDFKHEWIRISDQARVMRDTIGRMTEMQGDIDKQRADVEERFRVHNQRMVQRWEGFLAESQKQTATAELDIEQKWTAIERRQQTLIDQIDQLQVLSKELHRDKETLVRMQSAQSDAIKKFSLIWMEENEKAIAADPDRRRQPDRTPVPDEV